MEVEFEKKRVWDVQVRRHLVILGVNGVVVDGDGLILWENDATGSRKVFKYLLGLWDTIKNSKNAPKVTKSQNAVFYNIFLYTLYPISYI